MSTTMRDALDVSGADAVEETGEAYAKAMELEYERVVTMSKLGDMITESLLGQENPLTKKPHSYSSATEAAHNTPQYEEARDAWKAAEVATLRAKVRYLGAELRGRAAVKWGD